MVDSESRSIERVRVAVRVRPRNQREEGLEAASKALHTIDVDDTAGKIYVSKKKPERGNNTVATDPVIDRELRCTYDRVFPPSATQNDVFDYVRDAVQQVAQGFNCTIFAYGQTGTGKTHTMLGKDLEKNMEAIAFSGSVARDDQWGVIPRAVESLFGELESIGRDNAAAAIVHCSYMQIYNNEVYDLLQENKSRMKEPLAVREMIKGNDKQIYVSGLSEFRVAGLEETLRLLRQGNKNRTIRATEYNEKSSRSHALLQLSAEVESRGVEGPTTIIRRAKLNLVDLAGSEKWDTDVSMGSDRCKELTSINQSLSALGNVISALANPRRTHVPYRDAKLTRLLQDSLGGNTRTTVIATISQDESAIDETISTLLFADRAKCVTLRVKANEVVDDAVLLAQARREIARLKLLIKKNASQDQLNELEQKVVKLTQENTLLTSENKRLKQAMAVMKKEKEKPIGMTRVAGSALHPEEPGDTAQSAVIQSPVHVSTSTHSAHKLRLEIEQPHRGPTTPRNGSTSPSRMSQSRGSFCEDDDKCVAAAAAVVKAEQDQSRLLEQIQSERRALERELERIELQQTPRKRVEDDDSGNAGEPQATDDDACPICGRLIDDHSDDELDNCIEQETAAMKQTRTASGVPRSVTPHGSRPAGQPAPSHPRTSPPARRLSTPRGHDANGNKKPASPYSQELFLKPQTPSIVSPVHPQPPQASQLNGSKLGASSATQRRSVRDLAKARSLDGGSARDDQETETRPLTADAHSHISNNSDHSSNEVRLLNVPIVRQGSKSVKALKKFQASSPYNASKMSKRSNGTSGSPPRKSPVSKSNQSASANSSAPGASSEGRVLTGSMRDVGLALLIYKFRYDCWYPCTVVGYDAKRRLHCCQYEYGDKQWQELSQHKIKLVDSSSPGE